MGGMVRTALRRDVFAVGDVFANAPPAPDQMVYLASQPRRRFVHAGAADPGRRPQDCRTKHVVTWQSCDYELIADDLEHPESRDWMEVKNKKSKKTA